MHLLNQMLSEETQWKLKIVQRNLEISHWIDLLPEAQVQILREVVDLSEELPVSTYRILIVMLKKLLNHTSEPLKLDIQSILSDQENTQKSHGLKYHDDVYRSIRTVQKRRPINIFVRQPFTESGHIQKDIIQGVLNSLDQIDQQHYPLHLLTGTEAQSQDTFRQSFEEKTGLCFTPSHFRQHRLQLLNEADAMIIVRTSLSESGAFEVAYNTFGGRKIPMFFAVWQQAPIKTTLLRDLDEVCHATYVTFDHPDELIAPLVNFLATVLCPIQPLTDYSQAA